MELRQLEYFVAVAEEANFTRAAERVNISQSGISAQIKALEKEVGAELIDRSSRVARLTVAGTAAVVHARRALESSAALRDSVDEVLSLVRGRVAVGMVTACTVTPLFDALAAFHSAYPGVDITLAEANSDELIARVRSGALDVALVGTAHGPPEGLESLVMITEGLAACVPPGHPLSTASAVTLGEVCAHRVVLAGGYWDQIRVRRRLCRSGYHHRRRVGRQRAGSCRRLGGEGFGRRHPESFHGNGFRGSAGLGTDLGCACRRCSRLDLVAQGEHGGEKAHHLCEWSCRPWPT